MLKEQIVKLVSKPSTESSIHFEAIALNLLSLHLKKQKKPLQIHGQFEHSGYGYFDALAPEGFDDFKGPTLIYITLSLSKNSLNRFFFELASASSAATNEINALIICGATNLPGNLPDTSLSAMPDRINKVEVWSPENLIKIANEFPDQTNHLIDSIFRLKIEHVLSQSTENWKETRDEIISKLKNSFDASQFSLFLGAGVSASAGMQNWGSLLNSLFVSLLTKKLDQSSRIIPSTVPDLVERVNSLDGLPALVSARYLRRGLSETDNDDSEFIETVRKNLYSLRDKKYEIASSLLKSITTICIPQRTGARVQSVVTYNFDDLLERQLQEKGLEHKSITVESDEYGPNALPVFHVHGFLPEEVNSHENHRTDALVFSEEGYHRIYADPYHWSNLVQLNCLRENVCLMVGLSMTDPNLRRLLEIAGRNRKEPKHFAFMKRMSVEEFCKKNENLNSFTDTEAAVEFLNRHHSLNELVLRELGVTTIWFENYEEIPVLLDSLRDC